MYDFMVLGGDMRQAYLADILTKQGYQVAKYLLPEIPCVQKTQADLETRIVTNLLASIHEKEVFLDGISQSSAVLAPIPITKDKKTLNHMIKNIDLTLDEIYESLMQGQTFFGGCIPKWFVERCEQKGCHCFDYMEDKPLAVRNAVATAEGVLAEAILKYPGNLHDTRCLVLGFGKCGRVIAEKLKGLSSKVTVCVRRDSDEAWAKALGYEAIYFDCDQKKIGNCSESQIKSQSDDDYKTLRECIGEFPLVFNTVPYVVLTRELLSKIKKDGMIFDIASAPGGVDYKVAARIGVVAECYPSLPGKYAPKASAEIMTEVIKRVMRKE